MIQAPKNRLPLAETLTNVLPKGKFWTHRWHLVSGCVRKSPGCENCWMEMETRIRQHNPHPTFQRLHAGLLTADGHWNGTVRMNEHLLDLPLKNHNKTRVYAIWTDLFHEQVTNDFRDSAFAVMTKQQQDWFVVVTKRPDVAARYLEHFPILPLSNVIILVTMEDQERADERGPWAIRLANSDWSVGILAEPLLSHLYVGGWLGCGRNGKPAFSWFVTGGESGRNARPCHSDWVKSLRDQANAAGAPFMLKQWGEWAPWKGATPDVDDDPEQTKFRTMEWEGGQWNDVGYPLWCDLVDGAIDPDNCTSRVGKKAAGRLLDGAEYLEVPAL